MNESMETEKIVLTGERLAEGETLIIDRQEYTIHRRFAKKRRKVS